MLIPRIQLSTPESRKTRVLSLPATPHKHGKVSILANTKSSPSRISKIRTPFHSRRYCTRAECSSLSIETQINDELTEDESENATGYNLQLDMSDERITRCGITSPLSDCSSNFTLLSSPENEPHDNLISPDIKTDPSIMMNKEAFDLNRMIVLSLIKENKIFAKSIPMHKYLIPKKPLLKYPKNSLNYIVTSSRGSVEDATIYATEINTNTDKLPIIKDSRERLTIPINPLIKKRYKKHKFRLLAENPISDDELSDNIVEGHTDIPDAAIVRGYTFDDGYEARMVHNESGITLVKRLRWSDY